MIDLLVVGAGPAGLMTAIHAARAGLQTVVMDPREGPIDKACGEGLMPGALRALQELGVPVQGQPLRGIRYLRGAHTATASFRSGQGAGVRRTELQSALRARAMELGVQVHTQSAGRITQSAESVTAQGICARYLVAADGLHSPIRRQLNLDVAPKPDANRRWGVRQHYEVAPWTDFVEVHWASESELYVTPVGPTVIGVAVLSNQRRSLAESLSDFSEVAARLPAGTRSAARGAGPLRQRSRRRVAGRVLLVGDAAGYIDALTGDGLAVSQASAAGLVRCLVAEQPEQYERCWRAACRRYRVITESLLWARNNRVLSPAIVPAAERAPWLFSLAVNELAR